METRSTRAVIIVEERAMTRDRVDCLASPFRPLPLEPSSRPIGPGPSPRRPAKAPGEVIGGVRFSARGGEEAIALLDARGRWDCPRLPVLNRVLNTLFDPRRDRDLGDTGPFGRDALRRVARWLNGDVVPGAAPGHRGDGPGRTGA